jgi:enamine deaminase RidA (YjgF/YER057c/UK114 family)
MTRDSLTMVNPETLPKPRGYTHGMVMPQTGRVLFIAGQIGCDGGGRLVSDRFVEQFDRALGNVLVVLAEAGGQPSCIGKLTIFVTDMPAYLAARPEVGDVYRRHMGRHYPAMSLVGVSSLVNPAALVEIEGFAVV